MGYDPNQPSQPPYGQPGQPPYSQPEPTQYASPPGQPYGQPGQPAYGQPQYQGIPPVPNFGPPPQKKRSLRWLWITLSIVGVLLVAGCSICGFLSYKGIGIVAQAVGPITASAQFYKAVQVQDYTTAYTYIASNATVTSQGQTVPITSQQAFIQFGQLLDTRLGVVTKYTPSSNGTDTQLVTETVTRGGKQYVVHLTFVKVGNDWKIKDMDGI